MVPDKYRSGVIDHIVEELVLRRREYLMKLDMDELKIEFGAFDKLKTLFSYDNEF